MIEVYNLGDFTIGRFRFEPAWPWAGSVKPVAGTDHCVKHHIGERLTCVTRPAGRRPDLAASQSWSRLIATLHVTGRSVGRAVAYSNLSEMRQGLAGLSVLVPSRQ